MNIIAYNIAAIKLYIDATYLTENLVTNLDTNGAISTEGAILSTIAIPIKFIAFKFSLK